MKQVIQFDLSFPPLDFNHLSMQPSERKKEKKKIYIYRYIAILMRKLLEGLVCEGLDNFIIDTRQLNDKKWGF